MVLETPVFHRIDAEAEFGRTGPNALENRRQRRPFGGRGGRKGSLHQCGEGLLGRAGRGDQGRQERRRRITDDRGHVADVDHVLSVESGSKPGTRFAIEVETGKDRRHQCRKPEVHREIGEPQFLDGRGGHEDHLGIRPGAGGAENLGADLAELPFRPQLRTLDPDHLSGIAEPEWPWPVGEAGGRDPCDLHGHVGAQRKHAMRRRVHQPEGLGSQRGAAAGEQAVLELDQRRFHPLVAVGGERRHQPLHRLRLEGGVGRKGVGHSRGKQGPIGELTHGCVGVDKGPYLRTGGELRRFLNVFATPAKSKSPSPRPDRP